MVGNVIQANAQKKISEENFIEPISVFENAKITNVGSTTYSISEFINIEKELTFDSVDGANTNLGFSKDNYWLKFSLTNSSEKPLSLYFETGRPITDIVELHQVTANGNIFSQVSGDLIPFEERPTNHRKIIFPIELEANTTQDFYVQY
ncbi:7TMR-DISM extracellular 2 [Belliella baltica DSM 15883]|uniref:7TMR-DISM extracellular 2 n=2 Tax=Belliella TaxID=232244 RepID=I3Z8G4_BELBD|nr:7TMR-DISM extracellular 2 [Belliella baltica DSM 15883]